LPAVQNLQLKEKYKMISIKVHKTYRSVVAVCDSGLLNKKFEEGIRQLDLRENFYKGEEIEEEEAIKRMRQQANEDFTFNIVGKESTQAAIKAGIIDKEDVDKIDNIPFALTLL